MSDRDTTRVDHLLSRADKVEMIAPLSRLAVIDNCFGIGGVWFASGREFHSSEGFPAKAELALFLSSGDRLEETQHTRGWFPSVCWHRRVFERGKIVVRELKFIAGDAVFDVLELLNHTEQDLELRLVMRGRASAEGNVSFRDGRIHVEEEEGRTLVGTHMILASEPRLAAWFLSPDEIDLKPKFEPARRALDGDRVHYMTSADLCLPANGRAKAAIAVAWDFTKRQALSQLPKDLLSADSLLPELKEGWRKFWEDAVPTLSAPDEAIERLYYYGWYVLRAQTMPPQGRLPHIYVAPTKFAHVGVWVQDHSYIATGARWLNNIGLSQNSIRLLEKNQLPNGLMPSSVNAYGMRVYDKEAGRGATVDLRSMGEYTAAEIPSQFPPAFTIAAEEVYNKTGNLDFLRECFQAALKLDDWMAAEREDSDGLFKALHMMDIEHCAGSRRLGNHDYIKAVDVSALNVYHRRLLLKWAADLKEMRKLGHVEERAERTARSILEKCWDGERGFFFDLLPNDEKSPVETAAGFYTMYGLGSELRSNMRLSLLDALQDRTRFRTSTPIPTVSLRSDEHGQEVSQSVDWFVVNGLVRQNAKEPAERIVRKLLKAHLPDGQPESREGFDARTGEGKGYPDFSWIALTNDLLISRIMGIQPQRTGLTLEPWLPDSWEHAGMRGFRIGPYLVDVDYYAGRTGATIKIRPTAVERTRTPMPVNLFWRTRPGERVESVKPRAGSAVGSDSGWENRQMVQFVWMLCPVNVETVVNIRTRRT